MFNNIINDVSRWSLSDRFIPRRSASNFDYSHHLINNTGEGDLEENYEAKTCDLGIIFSAKQHYYKQNYISQIRDVLLPRTEKVLDFSIYNNKILSKSRDEEKTSWPVIPRRKPLLSSPSWVLDMPNLDANLCRHVVDWGKQGIIAAVHEGDVHFWHPTRTLKRQVTNTMGNVKHCIKWNAKGTQLAMAQRGSTISIWDMQAFKEIKKTKCICYTCSITSMVWTRSNYLLTGCSNGRLVYWSPDLECISHFYAHNSEIINIKLSCTEDNLVTSGIDKKVQVFTWPSKSPKLAVKWQRPIKALDWHPWMNSLLAVGGDYLNTIYNVNTLKVVDSKVISRYTLCDSLTFNPNSGELVISEFTVDPDEPHTTLYTSLSVMRNLDYLLDEIQYKYGRYTYLLWDSTGTKLATASSDENLCIWDFFGKSTKTEKRFLRKNSKNHTTNMFRTLEMFDSKIR